MPVRAGGHCGGGGGSDGRGGNGGCGAAVMGAAVIEVSAAAATAAAEDLSFFEFLRPPLLPPFIAIATAVRNACAEEPKCEWDKYMHGLFHLQQCAERMMRHGRGSARPVLDCLHVS